MDEKERLENLRHDIELLKGRIGSLEAGLLIQRDFAMKLSDTVKELDKTIALVFYALKDDKKED